MTIIKKLSYFTFRICENYIDTFCSITTGFPNIETKNGFEILTILLFKNSKYFFFILDSTTNKFSKDIYWGFNISALQHLLYEFYCFF